MSQKRAQITKQDPADDLRVVLPLREYLVRIQGLINEPVNLQRLVLPFGMDIPGENDEFLLTGHVVEELISRHQLNDLIDCIDIAAAAWELGHEEAGLFLDEAPYRILESARARGLESGFH